MSLWDDTKCSMLLTSCDNNRNCGYVQCPTCPAVDHVKPPCNHSIGEQPLFARLKFGQNYRCTNRTESVDVMLCKRVVLNGGRISFIIHLRPNKNEWHRPFGFFIGSWVLYACPPKCKSSRRVMGTQYKKPELNVT